MNVKVIDKPKRKEEEHLPEPTRLEQWTERYGNRLHGQVYNHPRFPDGEWIITSRVVWIAADCAQTLNTFYKLGQPA